MQISVSELHVLMKMVLHLASSELGVKIWNAMFTEMKVF